MKRKFWTILLTLVAALCLCFAFTACDETKNGGTADNNSQTEQSGGSQGGDQGSGTQKPDGGSQNDQGGTQGATHTHQFSSSWSSDDATHWHAATCGHSVKQDESAHTYVNGVCTTCNHAHKNHVYGNWYTVEDATCTKAGLKKRECSCGAVQTESIPQENHVYGNWRTVEDATCTKAGTKQRECSCGAVQTESIPQKDHSYANSVCTVCGAVEPGAVEVKVYIDNILKETLYTNSSKGYKIALPAKPEDMTTDPELKNYFDGWYADKGCTTPLTGEETYSASSAIYGRNIVNKGWGCKYEVNNGNVTITALIATSPTPSTDVVVPAYFNSFPVTKIGKNAAKDLSMIRNLYLCENLKEIGDYAFYNCNSMQKVALPSSLISIGGCAFEGCSSLQSIEIPDSVTSIGSSAFRDCSGLTSVTIGSGVTSIGSYAFEGCSSLQSIEIPDSVTSIGSYAFEDCSGLTSVTIGSGVISIGDSAFSDCSGLKSVIWNAENCTKVGSYISRYEDYTIFKKCTNLNAVTFGENVKTIPAYAFYNCSGLTGDLKIPDGVTLIGDFAFDGCSGLQSITIGSGVTEIGSSAFYNCSGLTGELKIPDSVTSIGYSAFYGCNGLTSVTIGSGVTSIGEYAFENCSGLEKIIVDIGNTAYSSQDGVLYNKTKSTIILVPRGIKGTINIPENVISIGQYAFGNCSGLERINVAETNRQYSSQDGILYDKNKTEIIHVPLGIRGAVTIPKGVTELSGFSGRINLQSVSFENDSRLEKIHSYAFSGCTGLQSITIPKKCIEIGGDAFEECTGLSKVFFEVPEGWYYIDGYYNWDLSYHEDRYDLPADKLRDEQAAAGLIKNDHTLRRWG